MIVKILNQLTLHLESHEAKICNRNFLSVPRICRHMSRVYWSRCFSFRHCCCPYTFHTHCLRVLTYRTSRGPSNQDDKSFSFLHCNGGNWWSFIPSGSSLVFKDYVLKVFAFMFVNYIHAVPWDARRWGKSPGTRVTGDCELPCRPGNPTWEDCFYSPSRPFGPFTSVFRNILA